jgi:hypothetical protein
VYSVVDETTLGWNCCGSSCRSICMIKNVVSQRPGYRQSFEIIVASRL